MNRKNSFLFKTCCYLGGLVFLIPPLAPLVLCSLLCINSNISFKHHINKVDLVRLFQLSLLFLPAIILINFLSGCILTEYVPQKLVQVMSGENSITYAHIFSILIISPIIEEFYFRKILLEELTEKIGILWAVLVSALYFSLVHFNILAFSTLFVFGIFLGFVFKSTKSILLCIFVHSLFNLVMLLFIVILK